MTQQSSVRLGVLGAGTVGSALIELIGARPELGISLGKVLVRDLGKDRGPHVPKHLLTTDMDAVLDSADVVVELIGGVERATEAIVRSLEAGKKVVTANKAVLAERWGGLEPYLAAGQLYFEAAVMAGTPVIGPLTGALRGSRPLELHAILNGTCNYILSQLEQGTSYDDALAEAQQLGYAEADPTLDVEGFDAAHKLTVLARLAFDPNTVWDDVKARTVGISALTPAHVKEAMEDGGRVRLVGSVYPADGAWRAEVRPVYLPPAHPLAGSASSRNGMVFRGDAVGEVFISGAGAGANPTASAVLADIIAALAGRPGPSPLTEAAPLPTDYLSADYKVEVLGTVL
ncbi:MAG: homoserine dehydrogenase [Trueperaceae bacterium]|nr:homoserine dehydrogenase [Trueperaceae bacterium]